MSEPEPIEPEPIESDPNTAWFTGMEPLAGVDDRGLPPGFPAGFPAPAGAELVRAERSADGDAELAAWRSTAPFTGYRERLREFGCTFGAVPRVLTNRLGLTRYTLYREGAGGSITLHRTATHWYVGVVWQPVAEPPAKEVDPHSMPDNRPLPGGPDAARELALFLMPPPLVPGYEAVLAFGALARDLSARINAPRLFQRRRPGPAKVAAAVKPLLRRLDAERLTLLRHVSLTMVNNILDADRHLSPEGLTLKRDEDGHLYAADIRDRMRGVLDEALIPMSETAVAVVEGVPIMYEQFAGARTAAVRPPPDRYAWVFKGLDSRRLGAARDAVWGVFG